VIQSCGNYLVLCAVFVPWRVWRGGDGGLRWYLYAMVAVADVQGNYFVVLAYQYTDVASATLLDCFTIPCVVLLSILFLRSRYSWRQGVGILCCVTGLGALLCCDLASSRSSTSGGSHKVLGDCLVLLGCVFYAVSNVAQERVVKAFDPVEFLANIGAWGLAVSSVQIFLFESDQLSTLLLHPEYKVWAYLCGYVAALSCMYIGVPCLLCHSSATVMNLSFLTSDFWAVLAAVFLFGEALQWYYFCAVALVLVGVFHYHTSQHQPESEAIDEGKVLLAETLAIIDPDLEEFVQIS